MPAEDATVRADGELWIGANQLPSTSSEVAPRARGQFEHYEGVWIDRAQVGGAYCNHEVHFGLRFVVPASDPLATLANSYYGSNIPGFLRMDEFGTSLDQVVRLRAQLTEIGLDIDSTHYFHFAEAYIPIEAESAWAFATRRSLRLLSFESKSSPTIEIAPSAIGLQNWLDVDAYLRAAWLKAEETFHHPSAPARWHAAAVFPNSD